MSPEGQHAGSEDASRLRVQCQPRHASLIQCSIVSTLSFIGHFKAIGPATLFSSQRVNVNDATQLEINPGVTVTDSIAINNGRKKFGLRKENFRAGKSTRSVLALPPTTGANRDGSRTFNPNFEVRICNYQSATPIRNSALANSYFLLPFLRPPRVSRPAIPDRSHLQLRAQRRGTAAVDHRQL
jgi:hypothetical protein